MNKPLTKAGRYQIVSELGRGAMGVVYEGFDPVIGRSVAIKTMLTEGLSGNEYETYRARFQREAQAAGVLAHPNIVTIYDFGEDEGFLFLAMELLKGKSIEKLLQEQSVLPIETIIPIYQQVCSALDFAHQHRIVHRDIKPANIMILENGLVKVADFGIAKMMATGMTRAGQILGTPNYMSPEQVKGRQVDGRSDIFALGVILYELVTGEKPFSGQNVTTVIYKIMHENPIPPRELEPTIHPGLSAVITKALAKAMDERYQSCSELAEDLKNYRNLGGQSSPSTTQVIQRPMLELAPNETAAIDVSKMRGPARPQHVPAVQPPAEAPVAHAPQAPPVAHVQAPPVPRVQPPTVPPFERQPVAHVSDVTQVRRAPFQTTPEMRVAPHIEPLPVEPPPEPPLAPPRVVRAPEVKPALPIQSPPPIQAAPLVEPRPAVEAPRVEKTPPPPAEPEPVPVAASAQPVAPPAAVPAERMSPLVWVGAATLLVIAAAGGYFLPHRGNVAPTSAPAVSQPLAESTATKSEAVTSSSAATQGSEQAGGASKAAQVPETTQAPPPAAAAAGAHPKPAPERASAGETKSEASKGATSTPAKPAASAGGTGELAITANVDGAKISIDGKGEADWVAPHTLTLPAGDHRVAVLKDGYVTWGKSVTVAAGATQSISATLTPPQGEVDITTDPPGLEVFIDGKSVGVTPVQTMVSVGEHKYKIITPAGQAPFESTFIAKETSIARKTISFR